MPVSWMDTVGPEVIANLADKWQVSLSPSLVQFLEQYGDLVERAGRQQQQSARRLRHVKQELRDVGQVVSDEVCALRDALHAERHPDLVALLVRRDVETRLPTVELRLRALPTIVARVDRGYAKLRRGVTCGFRAREFCRGRLSGAIAAAANYLREKARDHDWALSVTELLRMWMEAATEIPVNEREMARQKGTFGAAVPRKEEAPIIDKVQEDIRRRRKRVVAGKVRRRVSVESGMMARSSSDSSLRKSLVKRKESHPPTEGRVSKNANGAKHVQKVDMKDTKHVAPIKRPRTNADSDSKDTGTETSPGKSFDAPRKQRGRAGLGYVKKATSAPDTAHGKMQEVGESAACSRSLSVSKRSDVPVQVPGSDGCADRSSNLEAVARELAREVDTRGAAASQAKSSTQIAPFRSTQAEAKGGSGDEDIAGSNEADDEFSFQFGASNAYPDAAVDCTQVADGTSVPEKTAVDAQQDGAEVSYSFTASPFLGRERVATGDGGDGW